MFTWEDCYMYTCGKVLHYTWTHKLTFEKEISQEKLYGNVDRFNSEIFLLYVYNMIIIFLLYVYNISVICL